MDSLQQAAGRLMNRVRVNHVQATERDGAAVFVKRRRAGALAVIWFANRFMALAHNGTSMYLRADEWAAWEVYCAQLLYPERPGARVESSSAVVLPRVDGISVRTMVRRSHPDVRTALVLAARELRRVHETTCAHYRAGWSHGDLHLDNILCDVAEGRATLIDFDIRHAFDVSATLRQCDDVMAVLLEPIGWPDDRWLSLATAFVEEYRRPAVLEALGRQLLVPRGVARLLWYVGTNGASMKQIEPRLQKLQQIVSAVQRGQS
ncbi:MAG: hypothetical protein EXQ49_03475 [Acidobacteria bacterium]|nr:hypothetical protein [Acidobacteriota bacterium]